MKLVCTVASCLLLLSGCTFDRSSVKVSKDLPYASYTSAGEAKTLLLDLYLPPSQSQPQPLLIYIHGGGWREFSKEICPGETVAQKGWAIACINYRYSTEAIFPAQIHDAKAAVRWLRANASQYGLDPNRFGAWGASAGGHLSTLLGTSAGVTSLEGSMGNPDYSSAVQAVCNWYGPTDFTKVEPAFPGGFEPQKAAQFRDRPWYLYTLATTLLLGDAVAEKPELAKAANPITYIDPQDPPVMVLHGDLDKIVPVSQSELLVKALQLNNVPVVFQREPTMTHSYKGANGEPFDPQLIDSALAFFAEVLNK